MRWNILVIPALGRQQQEDLYALCKSSLLYAKEASQGYNETLFHIKRKLLYIRKVSLGTLSIIYFLLDGLQAPRDPTLQALGAGVLFLPHEILGPQW